MTVVAIIAVIGLCVAVKAADAHRPGLHRSGSLEAPLLHWLVSERQETNAIRRDKCQPRPYRAIRPARLVPDFARRYTIRIELLRQSASRLMSSACAPWPSLWERAALCVHSHEGAWNSNTGNGYYGGMQMDSSFQRAHGPDMLRKYGNYAHVWSVFDQLLVSWRAYSGTGPGSYGPRGWHPWPNTARMCGLL